VKPPNFCNSINCNGNLDKDYCIKGCSHAQWVDILVVNGKKYPFDFNQRFGPVFPTSGSVKAPVAFASSTLASIITDIDGAIFVHVSA